MAAAALIGVTEFYRIGGAQAIAAFAYGTQSIPRVNKIVGPGNTYVTLAKKLVAFDCGIDFLAGPTEIVYCATEGNAEFIASDLIAQAEHDPEALAIFVTASTRLAKSVIKCTMAMAEDNAIAKQALEARGVVLVAKSRKQAIEWTNELGGEHVSVPPEDVYDVKCAGSIFLGDYTAQSLGDYASGPNHTLPTGNVARYRGGLNVIDFRPHHYHPGGEPQRPGEDCTDGHAAGRSRRFERPCRQHPGEAGEMSTKLRARRTVESLKEYHPPLGGRDGLRLDFNENVDGCSPRVLQTLHSITAETLNKYPEREPGERAVANHLGIASEQVLLTNGVDEAIHLLAETYLEPGDETLIGVPTFSMYEIYALATGAVVRTVQSGEALDFPASDYCRPSRRRPVSSASPIPTIPLGRSPARTTAGDLAGRTTGSSADRRSLHSFRRRDPTRSGWHHRQSLCQPDLFEGVRMRASGSARGLWFGWAVEDALGICAVCGSVGAGAYHPDGRHSRRLRTRREPPHPSYLGLPDAMPLICYEAIFPIQLGDLVSGAERPGWLLERY